MSQSYRHRPHVPTQSSGHRRGSRSDQTYPVIPSHVIQSPVIPSPVTPSPVIPSPVVPSPVIPVIPDSTAMRARYDGGVVSNRSRHQTGYSSTSGHQRQRSEASALGLYAPAASTQKGQIYGPPVTHQQSAQWTQSSVSTANAQSLSRWIERPGTPPVTPHHARSIFASNFSVEASDNKAPHSKSREQQLALARSRSKLMIKIDNQEIRYIPMFPGMKLCNPHAFGRHGVCVKEFLDLAGSRRLDGGDIKLNISDEFMCLKLMVSN